MPDKTHDPPRGGASDLPIDRAARVEALTTEGAPIPPERLAALNAPGFEKYPRMKAALGGREPIAVIRDMKHGGYRFKSRRSRPGVLVHDRAGLPIPDRMSFRQIAPVLTEMSGVPVTYETVRRWYEVVFPGERDEPVDDVEDAAGGVTHVLRTESGDTPVAPARSGRREPAEFGDESAEAIRAAVDRARTRTTNPLTPPAAFLPPTD